jgi:hypothetical protein
LVRSLKIKSCHEDHRESIIDFGKEIVHRKAPRTKGAEDKRKNAKENLGVLVILWQKEE